MDETFILTLSWRWSGQYKSDFNRIFWSQIAAVTLFKFILLNNELKWMFQNKVRIFACSSDGQKSYCWRTFYPFYQSAIHMNGWERQCPNMLQIWCQIPNMETHFIPMLQSSTCISQTIFYRKEIDVVRRVVWLCSDDKPNWGGGGAFNGHAIIISPPPRHSQSSPTCCTDPPTMKGKSSTRCFVLEMFLVLCPTNLHDHASWTSHQLSPSSTPRFPFRYYLQGSKQGFAKIKISKCSPEYTLHIHHTHCTAHHDIKEYNRIVWVWFVRHMNRHFFFCQAVIFFFLKEVLQLYVQNLHWIINFAKEIYVFFNI